MTAAPYLTIAIPVKDGAAYLEATLDQLALFCESFHRDCEWIVVDDGSADATAQILARRSAADSRLRVVTHPHNRGKGAALKTAAEHSRGEILLTIDADASYAFDRAQLFIDALESGSDAAIGNRRDPRSQFVLYPRHLAYIGLRHAIGWVYNRLARALIGIVVEDTQCGFKGYRGELARRLFPQVEEDRFAFDLEVIALLGLEGARIAEVPVLYTDRDQPTSVILLRDGPAMLRRMGVLAAKVRRLRRSGVFADPTRGDYQDLARREGNPVQRFWHTQKWPLVSSELGLRKQDRVLDIGAGSSDVSLRTSEQCALACAVDVSMPALRFVQAAGDDQGSTVRCVGAEIERLPFAAASFDRVIVLEVIEHLPQAAIHGCLAEIKRVLAPGGRLLVTTPNYRSYWPLLEFVVDRIGGVAQMGGLQHISRFHARRLRSALETNGFRVLREGSVYHLSPFLAAIADRLSLRLFDWERRKGGNLGPILYSVSEPVQSE